MYGLTLVTPPAADPVSLAEALNWLKQEGGEDNGLVVSLVRAAVRLCEKHAGRQFVTATWRATFERFPAWGWKLPKAPLQSVTSVQYHDADGELQTLSTDVYGADASRDPGVLYLKYGQVWPVTAYRPDAVRVTFVAGYGNPAAVPDAVKQAVRFCIAPWYAVRQGGNELPPEVRYLLDAEFNGCPEYGEVEGVC